MFSLSTARGITLIEFLAVLLIVSILAALGLPAFTSALHKHRAKSAAETLHAHLRIAKTEAIKRNQQIHVNFNISADGTTWCYGLRQESTCDCSVASSCHLDSVEKVVSSSDFPNTKMQTSLSAPGNRLTFDNVRGIMDSTFGNIRFYTAENKEVRLIVNRLARFRFCSPAGDANIAGYSTSC
jgi:type IV fimbrial biogenesis protein FimT